MKTSNSQKKKKLVRSRELSAAGVISQMRKKIKGTNLSHTLSLSLKNAQLNCALALQWGKAGRHSTETIPPIFILSWAREMCHTSGSSDSSHRYTVTMEHRHSMGF